MYIYVYVSIEKREREKERERESCICAFAIVCPQATAAFYSLCPIVRIATMVAHSKAANPKKGDLAKTKPSQSSLGNQAVGFRNLMKYRASEQCKKAWAVWGSRGPISHIARIQ